jgi:hypothetical protein
MSDDIYSCELRFRGHRLRILTARKNVRPLLADYDIIVLEQRRGGPARVCGEATIVNFARGMGVDGLFSAVLSEISSSNVALDENGNEVPLPDRTVDDWRDLARRYWEMSQECAKQILRLTEPTNSPQAEPPAVPAPDASATKCARTACKSTRNVRCRHTQTGRLYCPRCARAINDHNPGFVEFPKSESKGV